MEPFWTKLIDSDITDEKNIFVSLVIDYIFVFFLYYARYEMQFSFSLITHTAAIQQSWANK